LHIWKAYLTLEIVKHDKKGNGFQHINECKPLLCPAIHCVKQIVVSTLALNRDVAQNDITRHNLHYST